MVQLILHLLGDYLCQSDWMALNKHKFTLLGWLTCFAHCQVYSLGFFICFGWKIGTIVFISHFIIDKFRLAVYWMKMMRICEQRRDVPLWLRFFLTVVVDNSLHIISNYLTILYLHR